MNKKLGFSMIVLSIIVASTFFIACQNDDKINDSSRSWPYLSFSHNADLSNLSEKDMDVVALAFQRLNISVENGFFKMKQTSGSQINVSEEVFRFLKSVEEKSNEGIISSLIRMKFQIRSRSEFNLSDTTTRNDCVACAIAATMSRLGYPNSSSSEIQNWIVGQYGNDGVPLNQIGIVLNHFLVATPESLPDSFVSGGQDPRIVIVRTGDTMAHAATLIGVSNSVVIYRDDQNGGVWRQCSSSDVIAVYGASGIKNSDNS